MLALWSYISEQGTVESNLYICGACNKQLRSYRLLVDIPLALFRQRLFKGHMYFNGTNYVCVSIVQSDPR